MDRLAILSNIDAIQDPYARIMVRELLDVIDDLVVQVAYLNDITAPKPKRKPRAKKQVQSS